MVVLDLYSNEDDYYGIDINQSEWRAPALKKDSGRPALFRVLLPFVAE